MRCVLPRSTGQSAQLKFTYLGKTERRAALKSGIEREQIGLKLRARDSCNLIYVMWRLAPTPSVVVSFKNNAEQATHAECQNSGYSNLKAEASLLPPPAVPGATYVLGASIVGDEVLVEIDDKLSWKGRLPKEAQNLEGPAGFRSDNVAWQLVDFDVGPMVDISSASEEADCGAVRTPTKPNPK
jgi:hypothetical protein